MLVFYLYIYIYIAIYGYNYYIVNCQNYCDLRFEVEHDVQNMCMCGMLISLQLKPYTI